MTLVILTVCAWVAACHGSKGTDAGSAPGAGVSAPAAARSGSAPATRVAVLNFGPPRGWGTDVEGYVGIQVNAKAWRDVIPLLEADRIDVVVVRVNSEGGNTQEVARFHEVFEREYKKRWKTVVWCDQAIQAACMSVWVVEDWYFKPGGEAGACTGWMGGLLMMVDPDLTEPLRNMHAASALGKHEPKLMRSMQIVEPLSYTIDDAGRLAWFQDESGKCVLNPRGQILMLGAPDAVRCRFARGIAATREQLAACMGLARVEWAGEMAAWAIDDSMRDGEALAKRWEEIYVKYHIALRTARALQGPQNHDKRIDAAETAKGHLASLKELIRASPGLGESVSPRVNDDWFGQQRELLRRLAE